MHGESFLARLRWIDAAILARKTELHLGNSRTRTLEFPRRPLVMGIVNVTPDSFSDGGHFFDREAAVDHALQLVADGADLLDIGGESTRPYADIVSADEEIAPRVAGDRANSPAIVRVPISIDTSKAAVARAAIEAGAEIINDVTGLAGDPDMLDVAVETGAACARCTCKARRRRCRTTRTYDDVVGEIRDYLRSAATPWSPPASRGSEFASIPASASAKRTSTTSRSWPIAASFHELGCPLLVGHSRKGFLGKADRRQGSRSHERDRGAALGLAVQGVQIVRVHDVRPSARPLPHSRPPAALTGRVNRRPDSCYRPEPNIDPSR